MSEQIKAEYVDHMGGDLSVVNAARVSFAKESKKFEDKDEKLIKYLAKHKHELPFAHTAITLRCSAPVPIRTQCFKSKIGFVENEESRRYITSEPELFIPDSLRMAVEDKKQGSGEVHPKSAQWLKMYTYYADDCLQIYKGMIDDNVCPEQARFVLPQGVMVNWIWTGSLLAYARFYNLRSKPDAQKEVQAMAEKVSSVIEPLFPISWKELTK